MSEEAVTGTLPRITLTVDAGSYKPATVDIAVAMAASLNARLQGWFIEDADLLRTADLPCSSEITFPFARQRTLDRSSLQHSLQALGTQVRDYLANTAEQSHVQWSFSTISGKGSEAGLAGTDESELLIIGQTSSYHAPVMRQPYRKHILLIGDHSPTLLIVLEVVLKQRASTAMELILAGGKRAEPPENIEKRLGNEPNISITRLETHDAAEIIKLVARSPEYIILSRSQPLSLIQKILHASVCPVILVG